MTDFFDFPRPGPACKWVRTSAQLLRCGTQAIQLVTLLLLAGLSPALHAACSAEGQALRTVLPGIAVRHGRWPSLEPDRPPRQATSVVLWQGTQAVVLDPGATACSGLQLQRAMDRLAGRRLQVQLVVNSHAHAEQVLANSAWRAPVAALAGSAAVMRQRCPGCMASLTQDLGAPALRGTRIVWPGRELQQGHVLKAGGRIWQVLEVPMAHTPSDLLLWSQADGVLLVGGLLDGQHLVLAQGRVSGWLKALSRIEALEPRWLIAQHLVAGPGEVAQALARQREALCSLVRRSWQGLERWQTEAEVLAALAPQGTVAEQQLARANLGRAWREMEALWLGQEPMPAECVP